MQILECDQRVSQPSVRSKCGVDQLKRHSAALRQPATANEIEIIKRNRSLVYLKTKQFDAALSDAGFPNFGLSPTEKALFRAAEALYNLARFIECCDVLELLCANFPEISGHH